MKKILTFFVCWVASFGAQAQTFEFIPVTEGVYAYIGPTTDRTVENLGLNNNIGLVITKDGAVLIDSGAGNPSAIVLEKAAALVTSQPIVAVINTGSQDHRWLGNDYFKTRGAQIFALEKTVVTQQAMGQELVANMTKVSSIFADTNPLVSKEKLTQDKVSIEIGQVFFELIFLGDAHYPGDAVVWLPQQQVLFSGDLIYVDRMLGVLPNSNVLSWQQAFHKAESLPAKWIVPGHGQVSNWARAKRDTGDYLDKLVAVLSVAANDMIGVDQAVKTNLDWDEFKHLQHYETWHKTILNRTYLQFESAE